MRYIVKYYQDVIPEFNFVDIVFDNETRAIELKIINTNIKYLNVDSKGKPITKNTQSVINDISKLNSLNFNTKAVVFIVFPIEEKNVKWQIQLKRINNNLQELHTKSFNFSNEIPGQIYYGVIK